MLELYNRYLNGSYQEVYDILVARKEEVFEPPFAEEALLIARAMMKRVRYNLELLVLRLQNINYQFGEGLWTSFDDLSLEEQVTIEKEMPILGTPTSETSAKIQVLEHLTGPLPLSLRCWYEIVGSINLIGLFESSLDTNLSLEYGCILDPVFMYSLDTALQMVQGYTMDDVWKNDPTLALAPDNYYKYGFSGSRTYSVQLPCKAFDAPLLGERHNTTFVNYLRICLKWGGFPGLEIDNRLTQDQRAFRHHPDSCVEKRLFKAGENR